MFGHHDLHQTRPLPASTDPEARGRPGDPDLAPQVHCSRQVSGFSRQNFRLYKFFCTFSKKASFFCLVFLFSDQMSLVCVCPSVALANYSDCKFIRFSARRQVSSTFMRIPFLVKYLLESKAHNSIASNSNLIEVATGVIADQHEVPPGLADPTE